MSKFETPLFRDLNKLIILISVGIIIGLAIYIITFYVIPLIVDQHEFIVNNECLYFEELKKSLCGQKAIDYLSTQHLQIKMMN